MNREGEIRFIRWIEKENQGLQDELRRRINVYRINKDGEQGLQMNREGELRLQDEWRRRIKVYRMNRAREL